MNAPVMLHTKTMIIPLNGVHYQILPGSEKSSIYPEGKPCLITGQGIGVVYENWDEKIVSKVFESIRSLLLYGQGHYFLSEDGEVTPERLNTLESGYFKNGKWVNGT